MWWMFLATVSFASELPGEQLYIAPDTLSTNQKVIDTSNTPLPKTKPLQMGNSSGNLPIEYLVPQTRQSTASELLTPPKGAASIFRAIKVGDIVEAAVDHSVIAFSDEKSPVVAKVEVGSLRGIKLIGESVLEPNTKRIFINFNRIVQNDSIYTIKGSGVSSLGQPGLTGEYHSREAEYFTGDFLASFTAGYFDGLVPRRTNPWGQIESDASVDSAVKKGLASGALSTAERFREKLKKVPEFSEIKGPFNLKILILDQAKTTN